MYFLGVCILCINDIFNCFINDFFFVILRWLDDLISIYSFLLEGNIDLICKIIFLLIMNIVVGICYNIFFWRSNWKIIVWEKFVFCLLSLIYVWLEVNGIYSFIMVVRWNFCFSIWFFKRRWKVLFFECLLFRLVNVNVFLCD